MTLVQLHPLTRGRLPRPVAAAATVVSGIVIAILLGAAASAQNERKSLFDGKTLDGWETREDDSALWKVADGAITGGSLKERVPHNSFVATKRSFHNFELRLKIRLSGTEGFINSGVQIRSVRMPGSHEMIGYQVDAGDGWWGKLYDESRRNKVIAEPADPAAVKKAVKKNDWNEYRIRTEGRRIRSWINGVPALDYTETEDDVPLNGHIAIQVHGGGKALVEVKDVMIEELPPTPGAPTWKSLGLPKPRESEPKPKAEDAEGDG